MEYCRQRCVTKGSRGRREQPRSVGISGSLLTSYKQALLDVFRGPSFGRSSRLRLFVLVFSRLPKDPDRQTPRANLLLQRSDPWIFFLIGLIQTPIPRRDFGPRSQLRILPILQYRDPSKRKSGTGTRRVEQGRQKQCLRGVLNYGTVFDTRFEAVLMAPAELRVATEK